jgi:hypothetical protein
LTREDTDSQGRALDPVIISAAIAAVAAVVVAALNRTPPPPKVDQPVVKTEAEHDTREQDRVIEALSAALMHCLQEHGS